MPNHFDDLLISTAHDGASTYLGAFTVNSIERADDVDQLMDAWYRERQARIEAGLMLDEARQLLRGVIAEGVGTSAYQRKVKRLLRAINASKRTQQDEKS
jgi:hypothetical protein